MVLLIESDNQEASRAIAATAAICASHGASWQPELRVRIRDGQMSLWAPPGVRGPLITMPTALLVPIDGARWSSSHTRLQLLAAPPQITRVQSELLELHIALYNATGKVRWWSSEHPARLLEKSPALAAAVERVKPGYARPPGPARGRQWAAEGFLKTRSFNHESDRNSKAKQVLLPLIDLLNHHHEGASLSIVAGAMVINPYQPDDTGQCYIFYGGRRDALDFALHYGFTDALTPYAHSAPIEMILEGIGPLRVKHQLRVQPDHPLDAPRVDYNDSGIVLSHLCCDRSHPQRLQTVLNLALQATLQRRGQDRRQAAALSQGAITAIHEGNQERLAQLIFAAEALQPEHPQAAILAESAHHQAAVMADVLGIRNTGQSSTASTAQGSSGRLLCTPHLETET